MKRSPLCSYPLLLILAWSTFGATALRGQYSEKAFSLKRSAELFDERGYQQSKSVSVDGKLVVANSNGSVAYSYPISTYSASGYPIEVALNYCNAVGFTAFKEYSEANPQSGSYAGWSRFEQNRPAWILGVNGFAMQVLSTTTHFHCDPASGIYNKSRSSFSDRDLMWVIDGYDFSNRMIDFGAVGYDASAYVDEIRLLRADGSVLELVNVSDRAAATTDHRPELYTGYYVSNEANNSGFGVVSFDSLYWIGHIQRHSDDIDENKRSPLIPRILRYYPGDGLEYLFREWVVPYGTAAYGDLASRSGGRYGGPTIFYLEEINGAGGPVASFGRSRHYPVVPGFESGMQWDSTRGRALFTGFDGHQLTYGTNSVRIEALGRTTTIRLNRVMPGGNATETNWMPLGTNGYTMAWQRMLAGLPETSPTLYMSHLGYVTEIIDPEGRQTSFGYQTYQRSYENYGFPRDAVMGDPVTVTTRNLRLTSVAEPLQRYDISYWGDSVATLRYGSTNSPFNSNNVVRGIRKSDRTGNPQTLNSYAYAWVETSVATSADTLHDLLNRTKRTTTYHYRPILLPDLVPGRPQPRFTELYRVDEVSPELTSTTRTRYSSDYTTLVPSAWGTGSPIPKPAWGTPYLVLPVETTTEVNNVLKSRQSYSYSFDTLRRFGGNTMLTYLFGREMSRRVMTTFDPARGKRLKADTVDFLNLSLHDSAYTRLDTLILKFQMIAEYQRLRALREITMSWEEAMFDPRILRTTVQKSIGRYRVPPQYALQRREVVADSNGKIITGRVSTYHTAISATDQSITAKRGSLAADSIIGADGSRYLQVGYDYGSLFGRSLPTGRYNANGSRVRLYYDYSLPHLARLQGKLERPGGTIRDNEDRTTATTIDGGEYFGLSLETPLADQQLVRRYSPTSQLRSDTLTQVYRRTFHGLISGVIDPNGWYTRFDYDRNGRLKMAWLPFDFQGEKKEYARELEGEQVSEAYGTTSYAVVHDTLYCVDTANYRASLPRTETIVNYQRLYSDNPPTLFPRCPPCNEAEKQGPEMLATCKSAIPFWRQEKAIARMGFTPLPASVESIARLDSAALLLNISSISGQCVEVKLESPAIGFSRVYLLNCSNVSGDDRIESTKEGSRATITGANVTPRFSNFRIDLTSFRQQLLNIGSGDQIEFTMTTLTSGARVELLSGVNAEDTRPRFWLKGRFLTVNPLADNTLSYEYDDLSASAVVRQKVDDSIHSSNRIDGLSTLGESRRSVAKHRFGTAGRLLTSEQTIGNPRAPIRMDHMERIYTGAGQLVAGISPIGDTISSSYDANGRLVATRFEDHSSIGIGYQAGRPYDCGINDDLQDFHGFCSVTSTRSERGIVSSQFSDAFDRVRREVTDTEGLRLTTRYEYDLIGRLVMVINPGGDTTRYSYDRYGRKQRARQPDMGTVSYAYDNAGNVRFSQTEQQLNDHSMTFNQYDDLNRITLIGEATLYHGTGFDDRPGTSGGGSSRILSAGTDRPRLTDDADPTRLNDDGVSAVLTANATLWIDPALFGQSVPRIWHFASLDSTDCNPGPSSLLGETEWPIAPFLRHRADDPIQVEQQKAGLHNFEHAAMYPHFIRLAIAYDTLPQAVGPVWNALPPIGIWHRLAPSGRIRNGRGREMAVAYRDKGNEPFHYSMLSYDERGRVEAMIRFTENLGFDAVYYSYNSMNQVISVRSADPFRMNTTWYGYDFNGRVDSVWTLLSPPGSGLSVKTPAYPQAARRPDRAELVYRYNRSGLTEQIEYPKPGVNVVIGYTPRKWIDSIVAKKQGRRIFAQKLGYDEAGTVDMQQTTHDGQPAPPARYIHDVASRLQRSVQGIDTINYTYDRNGNRTFSSFSSPGGDIRRHYYYDRTAGPNRLANIDQHAPMFPPLRTRYRYDQDGATTVVEQLDPAGRLISQSHLDYSYRKLTVGHTLGSIDGPDRTEWRYRFSPAGEREQKRMYHSPHGDSGFGRRYGWVYYQLGGAREALSVFHGQQNSGTACGVSGRMVRLYPVDYNTFSGGSAVISTSPSGARRYRILDHLGSTRVVLDSTGSTLGRQDYDAFGSPVPPAAGRQMFAGSERDRESSLAEMGVRMYSSETGRFLSIDPHWEEYRSTSPYHYCRNSPLSRIDPTGKWDIEVHVSRDRSKNGYGIAIVKDRRGNEVYRFTVRVEGVGGRNRMRRNSDTPLGTYDIPDNSAWIRGGSRMAYGPHPRLALDGVSGEIVESGRSLIRLHGGRQETIDPVTGRFTPVEEPTLQPTHGCLRTFDDVMQRLKEVTDELESEDEDEEPGRLIIIDDLIEVDGTYVPASEANAD